MNSVLQVTIYHSFFPLTLAGSLWYLDYMGVSSLIEKQALSQNADKYNSANLLFFLYSFFVGLWISFVFYLAFTGLFNILAYPIPRFQVFLLIFAACSLLSFNALGLKPVLIYTPLLGLLQAVTGLLAHSGYQYLADQEAQFFSQIPIGLIALVGFVVSLVIRSVLYMQKEV